MLSGYFRSCCRLAAMVVGRRYRAGKIVTLELIDTNALPMLSTSVHSPLENGNMLFEYLEERRLLAAVLSNGTLTVVGGNGNDAIALTLANSRTIKVQINQSSQNFTLASVSKIVVRGEAGNDTISMAAIN